MKNVIWGAALFLMALYLHYNVLMKLLEMQKAFLVDAGVLLVFVVAFGSALAGVILFFYGLYGLINKPTSEK